MAKVLPACLLLALLLLAPALLAQQERGLIFNLQQITIVCILFLRPLSFSGGKILKKGFFIKDVCDTVVSQPSCESNKKHFEDTGELCLQSAQCKSGCCHRANGLSLARCAPKAAETQECSPKSIYGVYYKCPCESGLTCEANKTIVGSIINKNFGVCKDPKESSRR